MKPHVCIHGHFYQPPRENPWLGEVEIQDSAYPFHDWNERIAAECYAPNAAARILDREKEIVDIVNNYAKISFNFGPTLLSWLEKHEPEIYQAVLDADQDSLGKFHGHGSALAQVYNHMIMPLASLRDKITQVLWGIKDFQHRFKRDPEGMWLPETAVDLETLEVLAAQDIRFTILSPFQAGRVRKAGSREWTAVKGGKVEPKKPYLVRLPSGRSLAVFFYDGPIAQEVAFGDLLNSGEAFAQKLLQAFSGEQAKAQIIHVATDGESYGHHHRFGDMALAYCLHKLETGGTASLTVYGEYLEKYPPEDEVEIVEMSSWSCVHGVERWRSHCGCHTGLHPGWTQEWRSPLREAMDWLRDRINSLYEREMIKLVKDPWEARDEYIQVVLDRSEANVESYISQQTRRSPGQEEKIKILKLLELQRNAMLMFTSCGWFFDEISGIESVQVMRYAGRAIQLAREVCGSDLEPGYREKIRKAPSNRAAYRNGEKVYERFIKPAELDLMRVGVHYAVSSLFEDYPEIVRIGDYTAQSQSCSLTESASQKLVLGKARVRSDIVWEEDTLSYAVLHRGDQNLIGGARQFTDDQAFSLMQSEIREAFQKGDASQIVWLMDRHFGDHNYSFRHLLRGKRQEILNRLLESTREEAESSLRQIFEKHYSVMHALKENNIPLPKAFSTSVEFILNADFKKLMEEDGLNLDDLRKIIGEFNKWGLIPDKTLLGFAAGMKVNKMMTALADNPEKVDLLQTIVGLLESLRDFPLEMNLWKSQNIYFTLCQKLESKMQEKNVSGDPLAKNWVKLMKNIGHHLRVKCI